MTTRKPLVNIGGQLQELPSGDLITGIGTFPFYIADGTSASISLTAAGSLPFYKADGSSSDIGLT
jgi:hypothetical protein